MRSFGELEARIMGVVWAAHSPVTVQHVVDALAAAGHPVAYTTAITVIERLRNKGWLDRERQGRSYLYGATRDEAEYTAWLMGEALGASSDRSAALLSFTGTLSESEADALRAALAQVGESDPRDAG
jgi:predicted transcriptional regulator